MKVLKLARAITFCLVLSSPAYAVHLDPGGRGQVLIYPYYTVNNHQQTLFSVTNTSSAAQAVKVRFREGFNSREVLNFNLWLPAHDVWTATVFALEDAGLPGEGAAIRTLDKSCTSPQFVESGLSFGGAPYVGFNNFSFAGAFQDGGPTGMSRTREGWIEVIAMTNVTGALLNAITHAGETQTPLNCAAVRPNTIMGTADVSTKPGGGLMGAASIVNVGQGTLLATRAEGLGGFTGESLFTAHNFLQPDLASVNDTVRFGPATAHRFDDTGRSLSLTYGGSGVTTSQPIDAVSAVLMAGEVYNEYVVDPLLNAGSDWVMTFPTKHFYTDPDFGMASFGSTLPPFEEPFSSGRSRVAMNRTPFDRESRDSIPPDCVFCPPPPSPPAPTMDYAVTVLPFSADPLTESAVLGSRLVTIFGGDVSSSPPLFDAGWARLDMVDYDSRHRLRAATNGNILHGLPIVGFWATNLVNNQVSVGVLSNYSAAIRHATSVTCSNADGTPCN